MQERHIQQIENIRHNRISQSIRLEIEINFNLSRVSHFWFTWNWIKWNFTAE